MISSAEIARRIIATPAPVLLLDTCAILDLMRDPTRDKATSSRSVDSARRLLQRTISQPRSLWLPITTQVWRERNENQPLIKQETDRRIQTFEERILRVQSFIAAHGIFTSAIAPSLGSANFSTISNTLVNDFFIQAQHIRNAPHVDRKALARVAANIAPSKKGQQTKDCLVIENYLQLATRLRSEGFLGKVVFLTTNKNDYSDPTSEGLVHPDLLPEFNAARMTYSVNFEMAEHQLFSP